MQKEKTIQLSDQDAIPAKKLLVSSLVQLGQDNDLLELQRGMSIVAQEGGTVGVIAAVVLDCRSQEATHLLLGYVPPTSAYRLVALSLVDRVEGGIVWLWVRRVDIDKLPVYQPD